MKGILVIIRQWLFSERQKIVIHSLYHENKLSICTFMLGLPTLAQTTLMRYEDAFFMLC